MTTNAQTRFSNPFSLASLFAVVALAGAMFFASMADSSAQILRRGVQGGLLGAGVGAIAGGGEGAAKGAAIGGAVGAVVGAAEKDANARRPGRPPAYGGGLVYDIQVSLHRLGYRPGPVDGKYGPRTADAIRAYQYDYRLPVTGKPSPALHQHMLNHGG